nr:LD-carboxypeptidase [uncultured Rhodoferax sp.]
MNKTIYIYSPSSAVRDKASFRRGVHRLNQLGYQVEIDIDALAISTRFAGDDASRVRAISRASSSKADIALISRGGYGLTRILNDIDFELVAQAIDGGTQFVGISDFTAFQSALYTKTGRISWAGPGLCEGFGVEINEDSGPDEIMEDCFNDLVLGRGEGAGWRQDKSGFISSSESQLASDSIVWGGNLSVLTSLLGTDFFPRVVGGILFLEDVGEHPYRIERMLTQLLYSGVLAQQKAIVLGQFTGYQRNAQDRGFGLSSVVTWLRSRLNNLPILTNLPYGHVQTKVLLPFGLKADLALSGKEVMLFWGD